MRTNRKHFDRLILLGVWIVFLFGALLAFSQEEPDPCESFSGVDLELCREYFDLIAEKDRLLKEQQDWNASAAADRLAHYDGRIAQLEAKLASISGKPALTAHLQVKIDRLTELRDQYDSTEEGSARDEAGKLGPKISAIAVLMAQIKQELGL